MKGCLPYDKMPYYIKKKKKKQPSSSKGLKTFLQARHMMSVAWPTISPDLSPVDNFRWKMGEKTVNGMTPSCKADLGTAIRGS